MNETILEIIGYGSSLIVLISFLMSSVLKLRLINLVGAGTFTVYAFLTHSYPTAVMNLFITLIDIYYLVKLTRHNTMFSILPSHMDSPFLEAFLDFYHDDIVKYFPSLDSARSKADVAYFVHCDMVNAGLILGKDMGDGTMEVLLDYSTPTYRDCSVGKYLYQKLPGLGYKKLVCTNSGELHEKYLKKMGFSPRANSFVKEL